MDKIYDIRVIDRLGEEHSMSEYRGKTLLIVNTALAVDLHHSMRA